MLIVPQINYITCKNHKEEYRMFYTAWGNQETATKTLICVHGLNRNSRDWDYVGNHFAKQGYYVIAPDIVGRGNSDYLQDPMQYDIQFYVADMVLLIKTLGLTNIDWIGTSMGGIIGMGMIAMANQAVNKLLLNDIGAEVERSGLNRIASYTGNQPDFDNYTLAKDYLLSLSREFGDLPDDVWEYYTRTSLQKNAKGRYELKRDVNISKPIEAVPPSDKNIELWIYWEKIKVPTLVIRGEDSDILSSATIAKMQQINLNTQTVQIANAGHAPFLYSEEHMKILENFLA